MYALPVYGARWRKARVTFLRAHPLCVFCEQRGLIVSASVVDHIVPHRGDASLFWDTDNWQSLCKTCHDSTKRLIEERGERVGHDVRGLPVDVSHHWYKKR